MDLETCRSQGKAMTPAHGTRGQNGSAYRQLKHLLVNYRFLPGEQLKAAELADQLGVSSTPVREALNRLYGETLLVLVPNKGFFAKTLSVQEMNELLELAYVLLGHSIKKNLADFTMTGIHQPVAPQVGPAGRSCALTEDFLAAHARFVEQVFERIVSLSGNEAMVSVIRNINDRTHYVRLLDLELPGHLDIVANHASSLVAQLQGGDASSASKNLRAQLDRMTATMPRLIREGIGRRYS
ncbi:MAG TPA: GntR family transcriptional regulator [Alphaproteobacteria bacterium]|nr:GntR family transcriptional regulator [Alphaproteobacteria bacterium]